MSHKNKTIATLLASSLGAFGSYRFYLRGSKDKLGWAHAASIPLSALLLAAFPNANWFFTLLPLLLSGLLGLLAALVLGLMSDEKWDARFNPNSTLKSDSQWPLAVILVISFSTGAFGAIALMARASDLLLTGGSLG